jgi:hypothetical protein
MTSGTAWSIVGAILVNADYIWVNVLGGLMIMIGMYVDSK